MAMVEEQKQVVGRVQEDGTVQQPEETKAYLALIKMQGGEHTWEMFLGIKYGKPATEEGKAYYWDEGNLCSTRSEVFAYLESIVDEMQLSESFVMTQNQTLKTNISVYSFMRMCLESDKVIRPNAEITVDELNEMVLTEGKDPEALWKHDMGEE